jgi:nucleoside-diphosphate-sugar epimerase
MKQGERVIIPGDGTSLWVFTWNADFAKGLLGLLGTPAAIGEAFHITSDEVLTWNQAYAEVSQALGVVLEAVHIPSDLIARFDEHATGSLIGDKTNSVVFDNSKIKRYVPDFACEVTWQEGVRRALAWFEADPARRTIDRKAVRLWERIITAYERALPD